jgi:hypothetical protein
MPTFREVCRHPEFERDLKRLLKRFRTLEQDLEDLIETALKLYHKQKVPLDGIFPVAGLSFEQPRVYVAKKVACRALKGTGARSGIRVVYSYQETKDCIELIEIYYKGDKDIEDKPRINRLYSPS